MTCEHVHTTKELWSFSHNIETSERKISMIISRDLKENKRQELHICGLFHIVPFFQEKVESEDRL